MNASGTCIMEMTSFPKFIYQLDTKLFILSSYSSFHVICSSQNVFTRIQTEFNKEIHPSSIYFVLDNAKANIQATFHFEKFCIC